MVSHVDSIRAWEHSYVQCCGNRTVPCGCHVGLGITVRRVVQGLTGSGEARECTLWLYLPSQHDYVTSDPLGSGRLLMVGSHCRSDHSIRSTRSRHDLYSTSSTSTRSRPDQIDLVVQGLWGIGRIEVGGRRDAEQGRPPRPLLLSELGQSPIA